MRITTVACALVLGSLVALSGGAHAGEILTLEAGATVHDVDPAVNGPHALTIIVWEDATGTPQVTLLLDGEPVEAYAEDALELLGAPGVPAPPEAPGVPAPPEAPGVPAPPEAPGVPAPPEAPALPPLPVLP